jgi:hypothetical protein
MRARLSGTLLLLTFIGGCAHTVQMSTNTDTTDFSLDPVALEREGLGFLTPVSATGQEANRVSLALAFADSITAKRQDFHVVHLAEVLSAVNQAGLSATYKDMMDDYQTTGIMEKDALRKVGEVSGARYLSLLELAQFGQSANRRFGVGGLRLMDTKLASIRLSWQIWDSETGVIAWEGSDEIHYSYDTGREKPVSFSVVAEQAAATLVAQIPGKHQKPTPVAAAK